MAIEHTDRMGLPTYTSGTDLHPTREDFNERMGLIDQLAAVFRIGTLEDRPLPETPGLLYICTDNRLLYVDTGTEWIEVRRLGHGGPGQPLEVGSAEGTEGESDRAARADHTHPLPLATNEQAGAMPSIDKARLDAATNSAMASTLMLRDSAGRTNVNDPSSDMNATNRRWVNNRIDNHTHAGTDITSGIPARHLPLATSSERGAMSATDKAMIDAATAIAAGGTLVYRTAQGQSNFGTPTHSGHVATKDYVDSAISTRAASSHTHPASQITGTLAAGQLPDSALVHRGFAPTDLNNATTPGIYAVGTDSSNAPTTTASELTVTVHPSMSERIIQRLISFNRGTMYFRTRHELTGWDGWQRVVTENV